MELLSLHRVDKKAPNGFAPAEHVALTISMNGWHLLMDIGKTIMSVLLAPGEKAESIPMIRLVLVENKSNALFARNDINAAAMKWTFTNVGGIINVKVSLLNHDHPISLAIEVGFKDKICFSSSSDTREPIRYNYPSECSSG